MSHSLAKRVAFQCRCSPWARFFKRSVPRIRRKSASEGGRDVGEAFHGGKVGPGDSLLGSFALVVIVMNLPGDEAARLVYNDFLGEDGFIASKDVDGVEFSRGGFQIIVVAVVAHLGEDVDGAVGFPFGIAAEVDGGSDVEVGIAEGDDHIVEGVDFLVKKIPEGKAVHGGLMVGDVVVAHAGEAVSEFPLAGLHLPVDDGGLEAGADELAMFHEGAEDIATDIAESDDEDREILGGHGETGVGSDVTHGRMVDHQFHGGELVGIDGVDFDIRSFPPLEDVGHVIGIGPDIEGHGGL